MSDDERVGLGADYDPADDSVADVKDQVREADLTDAELAALEQRERNGKDRVTLTGWLDSRHDAPVDTAAEQVDTDEPADPADAAPARQGPPRETDTPTLGDDDYDPATHHAWAPGEVPNHEDIPLVVVVPVRSGMIAGYNFAHTGDARAVARTRRVDDAIVEGTLVYQRDAPAGARDGDRL